MIVYLLAVALLHPVHATLSEIEWNGKTGRLEVALQLDSLDEQWLKKQNDRGPDNSKWMVDYVRRHVRVAPLPEKGKQDSTKYHWLGRQKDGAHVWWYFEIETPDGRKPEWIEQTTLFEREDNYTNRVLVLNANPKRSMSLTKKHRRGNLVD